MNGPKYLGFQSEGKLKFTEEMRFSFGHCVSRIIAVPVEGSADRYVLEVEICPETAVTKSIVFGYCDADGSCVSNIRVGSSVVSSKHLMFNGKKSWEFREVVEDRAARRMQEELAAKKEEIAERLLGESRPWRAEY